MAVSKVRISWEGHGPLYSPFSGRPTETDSGPNEGDQTLLFVHYGMVDDYAYVSERATRELAKAGVRDAESLAPTNPAQRLKLSATLIVQVDAGWNGVYCYCFAPLESDRTD